MRSPGLALALIGWLVSAPVAPAQETAAEIPTGTFASRQLVSSRARTRPANRYMRVVTTSWVLHRVSVSDGEVRVSSRYCAVEQEPLGRVRTTIGGAFVAAIPEWESTARITGPAGGPWSFELPEHAVVLGATLSDPVEDRLPADASDGRVVDSDGDGEPGVTVDVEGLVDGQVFLVQRLVRGLRGTLEPSGRMQGTVTGSSDQEVIGASTTVLRMFTPRFRQEPDPSRHTFVWHPLPEGSDCSDLLARRADVFEED